jgi:hypothetical protein
MRLLSASGKCRPKNAVIVGSRKSLIVTDLYALQVQIIAKLSLTYFANRKDKTDSRTNRFTTTAHLPCHHWMVESLTHVLRSLSAVHPQSIDLGITWIFSLYIFQVVAGKAGYVVRPEMVKPATTTCRS